MATTTEILALLIRADASGAITEFQRLGMVAEKDMRKLEQSSDRIAAGMIRAGAVTATAGAVITRGMWSAADSAAQLADSIQASDVIFGKDLSGSIESFAKHAEQYLGMSRMEVQQTLQSFATFGKDAGLTGAGLLEFSKDLTQVAADIASLKGVSNDAVMSAFSSGLAGEIEPLRRLGISLTDIKKRAEAVRLGIREAGDTSPLTGQQNVMATASLIKQSPLAQDASGDFMRTINELPNQMKIARAEAANLKAEIGEGAVPAFREMIGAGRAVVGLFNDLPDGVKAATGSFVALAGMGSVVVGSLSAVGGGLIKAQSGIASMVTKFKAGDGGAKGLASTLGGMLNPAVAAGTIAVVGGLAAWEAWASANAEVEALVRSTADEILNLADATDVFATYARVLNGILSDDTDVAAGFTAAGLSIAEVVAAVQSAPGALDKFRDEVDGVGGSMENLGGWLDAVGVNVGGGFDGMRASAEKLPPALRNVVTGIIDTAEAGGMSVTEMRALIDHLVDLDDTAVGSAASMSRHADQLWRAVPASERTAQAQELVNKAMDETSGVEAQTAAWIELRNLFPEAAAAAGLAATSVAGLNNEIEASTPKLQASAASLGQWEAAALAGGAAASKTAGDVASMADRMASAVQAQQALVKPAMDLESALIRQARAQLRLNELRDPFERQMKLADSLDKVRDATEGVAEATDRRRQAQIELDHIMKRSAVANSVPLIQEIAKIADAQLGDAKAGLTAADMTFGEGSAQSFAAQQKITDAGGRRDKSLDLLDQALAESHQINAKAQSEAAREVVSAGRDIERANRERVRAERDYQSTLSATGGEALDLRSAYLDLITASQEVELAEARVTGARQDGIDSTALLNDQLAQLGEKGILSKDAIADLQTWINNLGSAAETAVERAHPLLKLLLGADSAANTSNFVVGDLWNKGGLPPTSASSNRTAAAGRYQQPMFMPGSKYQIPYRAGGGWVNEGPKGVDTVPLWASPGEFVVNAEAARRFAPTLQSINSGGGLGGGTGTTVHQTITINVNGAQNPAATAHQVGRALKTQAIAAGVD